MPHSPSDLPAAAHTLDASWRAFQLRLADELKALSAPDAIGAAATRLLAQYLGASHCWYTEIGRDRSRFHSRGGWFDKGMPALPASGRIADYGPELLSTLSAGADFVVDDVTTDPRTAAFAGDYRTLRIEALLVAPLFKAGSWVANLNVAMPHPHAWSEHELVVTRDIAERTWAALENALAQAALRRERDRSRYIFDTLSEGFVLLAADDTLDYMNDAAASPVPRPFPRWRAQSWRRCCGACAPRARRNRPNRPGRCRTGARPGSQSGSIRRWTTAWRSFSTTSPGTGCRSWRRSRPPPTRACCSNSTTACAASPTIRKR